MVEQNKMFISCLDGKYKTDDVLWVECVMLGFVPQPNQQNQFLTYG